MREFLYYLNFHPWAALLVTAALIGLIIFISWVTRPRKEESPYHLWEK